MAPSVGRDERPISQYDARMFRRKKGRILAIKWGLNPNSSSLGVDVTFLLFGATALSLATPIVSALVRLRLAKAPQAPAASSANETLED